MAYLFARVENMMFGTIFMDPFLSAIASSKSSSCNKTIGISRQLVISLALLI